MHKFDQLRNEHLLKCDLCNNLLVEPVTIPCGNTLCKSHIDKLISYHENILKCVLCNKKHSVPDDGFIVNRRIQNALMIELNKKEITTVYTECKQNIEKATEQVVKIELLAKDPANYINEHFNGIKSNVNLRRENLKVEIDKYADGLLESLERNRLSCLELSKENFELRKSIEDAKMKLNGLINELEIFEINNFTKDKFEDIKINSIDLGNKFEKMLEEYKESLLLKKNCVFFYFERSMEVFFGNITDKNRVEPTIASIEEEILEVSQNCQLDKILMEPPRQFVEPHLESDLEELTEGPCEERIDDSQSEYLDQLQVQNSQIIHNPKLQFYFAISRTHPQIAYEGNIYMFSKGKNKSLYYVCKNKPNQHKCQGRVTLSKDKTITISNVKAHTCNTLTENAIVIKTKFTELKDDQFANVFNKCFDLITPAVEDTPELSHNGRYNRIIMEQPAQFVEPYLQQSHIGELTNRIEWVTADSSYYEANKPI